MGNSQPSNRTGKKVFSQKLENSKKTGVLSLQGHKLDHLPDQVYTVSNLTTLDVSNNKLRTLHPKLATLSLLKTLNCDDNELVAGSLQPLSQLTKLQSLSVGGNVLGKKPKKKQMTTTTSHMPQLHLHHPKQQQQQHSSQTTSPWSEQSQLVDPLPQTLPVSLKVLKLSTNFLSVIPSPIFQLTKLQKLDLSFNDITTIPPEIGNLTSLNELNLNNNNIVVLPVDIGNLRALKTLALENNQIRVLYPNVKFHPVDNPQPLPSSLFTDTPLIDLNLHGNPMTSTQLNNFDGYTTFLRRRADTNTKNVYGGVMANLSVTGLE